MNKKFNIWLYRYTRMSFDFKWNKYGYIWFAWWLITEDFDGKIKINFMPD